MSRAALNSWIAGLLDANAAPGTARIRQLAVRRFAYWLTAGGEMGTDPFRGVKAPRVEPPLVEPLTDDELRALIRTCAVPEADVLAGAAGGCRRHGVMSSCREGVVGSRFEDQTSAGRAWVAV